MAHGHGGSGAENIGIGGVLTFDEAQAVLGMRLAAAGFHQVEAAAHKMGGEVKHAGSFLGELGFGTIGKLAAGVGIAYFAHEFITTVNEMEKNVAKLATTFKMLSRDPISMATAMEAANQQVEKMEGRANYLGIKHEEYINTWRKLVAPMSNAGAEVSDIYKMTDKLVAASRVLGIPMEEMAASVGRVSAGMAKARDPFLRQLKVMGLMKADAEQIAAMSGKARIKMMSGILDNFAPGGEVMRNQMGSVFTSLEGIIEVAGEEMFRGITKKGTGAFIQLRDWLLAHQEEIFEGAGKVGEVITEGLTVTFSNIGKTIGMVWGVIRDLWAYISPYMSIFGNFFKGIWDGAKEFLASIGDVFAPMREGWDELKNSLKLLWSQIIELFGGTDAGAMSLGKTIGWLIGHVIEAVAQVIGLIAKVASFVVWVIANLRYELKLGWLRIKDLVHDIGVLVWNVFTQPIAGLISMITQAIDLLANTWVGKKLGITIETAKPLKEWADKYLGQKQMNDYYADAAKIATPEEEMLRQELVAQQKRNAAGVPSVKVEEHHEIVLKLDGKSVAGAVAKHQLDLSERAGATTTPWQRRSAVVRATPALAGNP